MGKGVKAQHLAQYLNGKGYTCLVVGTKANPGEWKDCKRFIGNEQVTMALSRLLAETKHRIDNGINSPKLALFLDDWLNTVALDSDLSEQFFLEAATRILTAGIIPYFLLQSDSKADRGTRHGAQLKNNFVHLLLTAPRENGRLDYSKIKATLIYPGDKQQYNVTLPIRQVIIEYNVIIYTHTSRVDLNNDDDDFVADITMSVAKKERRRIPKRAMRSKKTKAEQGRFTGGKSGLGYKVVWNERGSHRSRHTGRVSQRSGRKVAID